MQNDTWGKGIQSRAEQRELKRMAILRVAARQFSSAGFHKTTLADLAEELNVTKPTLYYYVKNKDDILMGILDEVMKLQRTAIADQQRHDLGYERLQAFFMDYAEIMSDDFGASMMMTRINAFDRKFSELFRKASAEVFVAVQEMIKLGIEDGSIASCNPKYTASALLSTINEAVYWHLIDRKTSPLEAAEKFFQVFQEGLQPAK